MSRATAITHNWYYLHNRTGSPREVVGCADCHRGVSVAAVLMVGPCPGPLDLDMRRPFDAETHLNATEQAKAARPRRRRKRVD